MSEFSIEVKNLGKQYPNFALENINFALPRGCIMGFVGQNGAGKTTTIKRLLGLISGSGQVSLLGQEQGYESPQIKQQIGVMLDGSFFSEYLRLCDLDSILKNLYSGWDSKVFYQYADRFQLPRKQIMKEFSKGMKTKAQLAAALGHSPQLLILDEPASGLDPIARSEVVDIFLEYIQNPQNAIFLSSHITADLERIADYITFLHRGKLVFSAEKDALGAQYALAKGNPAQIDALGQDLVISRRDGDFTCEALVRNRALAAQRCPGMALETPSLDELMLFIVRGEQQ